MTSNGRGDGRCLERGYNGIVFPERRTPGPS